MAWLFGNKKQSQPAGRPRVAVIDDEPDLCQAVALALEQRGYGTAVAHDGHAGLELIRRVRPDLVVLDIMMPRMNGMQVLAAMQRDPALSDVPIIIVTSIDDEGAFSDEEWAQRLPVRHFFHKPCDPAKIAEAVQQLLPQAS